MAKTESAAAAAPAAAPARDDYHGIGGAYVVDPLTGKRVPEVPAAADPEATLPPAPTK